MPALTPYPWHADCWHRICGNVLADRIPHALLLAGREGIGKRRFVEALVGQLLCDLPHSDGPCGTCRGCRLYGAGTHPDYMVVSPLPDGKQITVDGIRDCLDFTSLSRHLAKHQVVVIDPADAMNRSAANALLKNLEEPTAGTVFLLLTNRFSAIMPTIRSRCQRLALDRVDREKALAWLRASNPAQRDAELAYGLNGDAPVLAASMNLAVTIDLISKILADLGAAITKPGKLLEIAQEKGGLETGGFFEMVVRLIESMIYKKLSISDAFQTLGVPEYIAVMDQLDLRGLFRIREILLQHRRTSSAWSGLRARDRLDDLLLTVSAVADRKIGI